MPSVLLLFALVLIFYWSTEEVACGSCFPFLLKDDRSWFDPLYYFICDTESLTDANGLSLGFELGSSELKSFLGLECEGLWM